MLFEKKINSERRVVVGNIFCNVMLPKKLFEKCVVVGRAEVVFSKLKVLPF